MQKFTLGLFTARNDFCGSLPAGVSVPRALCRDWGAAHGGCPWLPAATVREDGRSSPWGVEKVSSKPRMTVC